MFRLAILWAASIPVLFLASFVYDAVVRSHDANLPGLLAVASLHYFLLKPWGLGLLIAGILLRRLADDG
jgi:hypothetical protein